MTAVSPDPGILWPRDASSARSAGNSYSSPLKTQTTSPLSFVAGCEPVSRSSTRSRRWPSTHAPNTSTEPSSGPRWTSASFIRPTASGSIAPARDTWPQIPHMAPTPYAFVSCHVERPLDDAVWAAFSRFQARRAGGFAIAALIRPPEAGEDEALWLARAREAAARG